MDLFDGLLGNGDKRPPAPEVATPTDVEEYNLEFAQAHGVVPTVDSGTGDSDAIADEIGKEIDESLGRNIKHKADFPWLWDPSRGVRWDFDPVGLRNLAQTNTWVGMLVQTITKEVAETPWTIVEAGGRVETQKRLSTHPEARKPIAKQDGDPDELPDETARRIHDLLARPNPGDTWHDMVEMWLGDLLEVGSTATVKAFHRSAYTGEEFTADPETVEPRALQPSPPEVWTKEFHAKANIPEGYWQFDQHRSPGAGSTDAPSSRSRGVHEPTFFDTAEMIWSDMTPRTNRRYGIPPTLLVEDFLQSLDLAITQEQQYLSRGSLPSGMIVFEGWDREEVKEWKQENEENIKGKPWKLLTIAGKEEGARFEPFTYNFDEMQFTERMKWYARVVASVFQVPTAVVGIEPERVNYATFQGERENFENNTLGPYLQKIERFVNHDLIHPHWGPGYRFEFLPGMSETTRDMISQRVRADVKAGIATPNEARRETGRPESDEEGADTLGPVESAESAGGALGDEDGGMAGGDAGFFRSGGTRIEKQDIPDNAYAIDDSSECDGSVVQGPQGGTYCVPDADGPGGGDDGDTDGDSAANWGGDAPQSVDLSNETDSMDLESAGIEQGSNRANMRIAQLDDGSEVFVEEGYEDWIADKEIAGVAVFDELGVPIPDHHYDPETGEMAKEGVQGQTLFQAMQEGGVEDVDEDSVIDAFAATLITGDTDMHAGNMMIREDGTAVPIDVEGSGGPVRDKSSREFKIQEVLDRAGVNVSYDDIWDRAQDMAGEIDPDAIPEANTDLGETATGNIRENIEAIRP